jgi:hypothetical protein
MVNEVRVTEKSIGCDPETFQPNLKLSIEIPMMVCHDVGVDRNEFAKILGTAIMNGVEKWEKERS